MSSRFPSVPRILFFAFASVLSVATVSAAPITFTAAGSIGAISTGLDPFFWENASIVVQGTVDAAAPPSSCGADCASYTPTGMNLLIGGSQLFTVSSPGLTLVVPGSGPSLYQMSGFVVVSPSFLTAFSLTMGLPEGVLGAGALSAPPVFAPSIIDFTVSSFQYVIVNNDPVIGGTFGVQEGGIVLAERSGGGENGGPTIPEPATFYTLGLALAGMGSFRWVRRKRGGTQTRD